MKNTIDADFNAMPAGGFLDKVLVAQRRKMFERFMAFGQIAAEDKILDVAVKPPVADTAETLAQWIAAEQRASITSCAIVVPRNRAWHHVAAGAKSQPSHDRQLPFADGEFEWAFCHDVIEHLGRFERQYDLLKELCRVSRKGVFVTASNRWHPIEFNSRLPLLHWLPPAAWQRMLKWTGKAARASRPVPELLDATTLKKLAGLLPGKPKHDVGHLRFLGVKAHLSLQVIKNGKPRPAIPKTQESAT